MNEDNRKLLQPYLSDFPITSLLIGKSETDKRDCVNLISSDHNVEEITERVDYDFITSLYLNTDMVFYVINLDNLSLAKQNVILKLVEEPPMSSHIIMLTSNVKLVLPTIITRSVEFKLHSYSKEELDKMIPANHPNRSLLLAISETADDLEKFGEVDLQAVQSLCNNIFTNISRATFPNAMSIAQKYIYYKEPENSKFSVETFISVLSDFLLQRFKVEPTNRVYLLCKSVLDTRVKMLNKNLLREHLIEQMLLEFWKISRYEN